MLKIDRVVRVRRRTEPPAGVLASAIVDIGEGLDLHVIAEGIERTDQLAALMRSFGCDLRPGLPVLPAHRARTRWSASWAGPGRGAVPARIEVGAVA